MKYYIGLFFLINLIACQSKVSENDKNPSQSNNNELKTKLPGVWETVAFRVHIHTFHNSDSTFTMEVKEGEWQEKMQIHPIQTVYEVENRFRTQYKNLSNSLLRTDRGIWNAFGDTLMLVSPDATYQYEVTFQNGKAELRALLDWDGDGKEDDEYTGIQRFIKE